VLRHDVARAIEEGKFHIYAARTVSEGIEVLSGIEAGVRDDKGHFPASSVFGRVERRLIDLAERLRKDPAVLAVEPNTMMVPLLTPNDTRYSEQWHYFESTGGINAVPAWDRATGNGVVVAVIDTGIVPHSDLNANVLPGYDFVSDAASARDGNGRDSNPRDEGDWYLAGECGRPTGSNSSWHGTHVAGTVAAVTNNAAGVAGVAFRARILPVRALAKCGGTLADMVASPRSATVMGLLEEARIARSRGHKAAAQAGSVKNLVGRAKDWFLGNF
jgi:subtilisin family serine protease